jgi:sugar phosphate isomerase/epimerase
MALKMSYCTLRWKNPDLEPALEMLKEAGWEGWEGRLPLDWLGPARRVRRICENTGMPMAIYTASGSPEQTDWEHNERNKRRIDYAAELGVDCFMFMSGPKPKGRPVDEDDVKSAAEGAEAWAEYALAPVHELARSGQAVHRRFTRPVVGVRPGAVDSGLLRTAELCSPARLLVDIA